LEHPEDLKAQITYPRQHSMDSNLLNTFEVQ
jgi:hypothetical protein